MKRILIATACMVAIVYVLSCNKSTVNEGSCTGPKAVTDSTQLLAFARSHGIHPVADTSWLYYEIISPGSGVNPVAASTVFIHYVARLMDGTYVDSISTAKGFVLNGLIKGWQYGLPKIKSGGRIKLLIPSALGYSCTGYGSSIPPDAPLYYDVYLDSLK